MKAAIAACVALLALPVARAEPPSPTAKAEMAKIVQMAGRWKGSGWIDTPSGRHESNSEETVSRWTTKFFEMNLTRVK